MDRPRLISRAKIQEELEQQRAQVREREAQFLAERDAEMQRVLAEMQAEQQRLLAETAQKIIEDSLADDAKAEQLKQAEEEKAALSRKIAALESHIKAKEIQETTQHAALAAEAEAERLRAMELAERVEQER